MLCPHCRTYVIEQKNVCPSCGAPLTHEEEEGLRALRQGRKARELKAAGAQVKSAPRRHASRGASRAYASPMDQSTRELNVYGDASLMQGAGVGGDTYAGYRRTMLEAEERGRHASRVQGNQRLHQVK